MNNILKTLLDMHKQMEVMMAHENAKNKMIEEEAMLLQEVMINKIRSDLTEIKDYYYQLGIKQYIFETDICINPLELHENRYHCIGFVFDGLHTRICQFSKKDKYDSGVCMYGCLNLRQKRFDSQYACSEIYKHWEEIKRNIECKIVEAFFKEQNENCMRLNTERENAIKILNVMRSVLS